MADRVTFTKQSAQRIARVVRAVESGNRDASSGVTSPRIGGESGKKILRICTFTGAWNIGSLKTVTFKYQTNTPNTVSALNLFANVPAPPTTGDCAVGREGTAWFLIAAVCITATT